MNLCNVPLCYVLFSLVHMQFMLMFFLYINFFRLEDYEGVDAFLEKDKEMRQQCVQENSPHGLEVDLKRIVP